MQKYRWSISAPGNGVVKDDEGDLYYVSDVEKLEADHKREMEEREKQLLDHHRQISALNEQIDAALLSGTQGEIIREQKEELAELATKLSKMAKERDLWREAHHACDKDAEEQIADLKALVKEKEEQINAALLSGTQGEIIRTQNEEIADLTAERDGLRQEVERLKRRENELKLRLGNYGDLETIREDEKALAGKKIEYPEDHEATLFLKTSTTDGEVWIAKEMKEEEDA